VGKSIEQTVPTITVLLNWALYYQKDNEKQDKLVANTPTKKMQVVIVTEKRYNFGNEVTSVAFIQHCVTETE